MIEKLIDKKIVDVAAGCRHSIFVSDQSVYACGDGKSGQLGIGLIVENSNDRQIQPTKIDKLENIGITNAFCGKFHSFFLSKDNLLWATGGNSFG